MIPFVADFDFAYGRADRLSPLVQRVVCDNPGPFTGPGTGTYLIGEDRPGAGLAVIDPGPADETHLAALMAAVGDRRVSHILLTHTHRDHAPLAAWLAQATGAPVLAARPPAHPAHASGGDETDAPVAPDHILADADGIEGDGWALRVLATPGHASNHLAFALDAERALFCGDHVMGWSTTVVAPPDGDMADYLDSLERVMAEDFAVLYPTHGAPIPRPAAFLRAYRGHRLAREAQVVARLASGDRTIADMVAAMYAGVDRRLWPAATLSVQAHLIKLVAERRATADPAPTLDARYAPSDGS